VYCCQLVGNTLFDQLTFAFDKGIKLYVRKNYSYLRVFGSKKAYLENALLKIFIQSANIFGVSSCGITIDLEMKVTHELCQSGEVRPVLASLCSIC
jgi:hypothetical protein